MAEGAAAAREFAAQWPCAALVPNASSRIRQANQALATMTGRPLESLLSQPLENLFTASAGAI